MLIPVYIIGFILGGLVLFAVARRIPNRNAKIWLKTIGVFAGPVFFLSAAIFTGQIRERTYEVEWLTGEPAAKYLVDKSATRRNTDVVVLRRYVGNYECYETITSQELANYLKELPTRTVQVHYVVTYDLFRFRTYYIKSVGKFRFDHLDRSPSRVGGNSLGESCFSW